MSKDQIEGGKIAPEQAIASRWLKIRGIEKRADEGKQKSSPLGKLSEVFKGKTSEEETKALTDEAYDLFVERDDTNRHIVHLQKRLPNSGTEGHLEELPKEELIKQGRIAAVFSAVKGKSSDMEILGRSTARVRQIDDRLGQIFSFSGVYENFLSDLSHKVRVAHQAREVRVLGAFNEHIDTAINRLFRRALVGGRSLTDTEEAWIQDSLNLQRVSAERRKSLLSSKEVFERVRKNELLRYKKELSQANHFAKTSSRGRYLKKVVRDWAEGKKILLTGDTGVGKTELIRYASLDLFGVYPEYVTGHQDMSIYELLGSKGLVKEGDIFRPAPLVRAWAGREGRGQPFMFDELDRTKNETIMGIKTVLNFRPGEKGVKVQTDSTSAFDVGEDFAVAATANIKSDKHQTATELDPAIVRIFDVPMEIDYMPAFEVYDLAIAKLMDHRGNLPLTEQEAREALKNLCDAASHIQAAYQGRKVMIGSGENDYLKPRGQESTDKVATLKKALLDSGRTLGMLDGWSAARSRGMPFEEYLNGKVMEFINNRAYPDEDRYHLVRIFALKGFLKGHTVSELLVAGLDQATLERWSGGGARRGIEPAKLEKLPAEKVVKLDPFRSQQRSVTAEGQALLEDEASGVSEDEVLEILKELSSAINWSRTNAFLHKEYLQNIEKMVLPHIRTWKGFREIINTWMTARRQAYDLYYNSDRNAWTELSPLLNDIIATAFVKIRVQTVKDIEELNFLKPLETTIPNIAINYLQKIFNAGYYSTDPEVVKKVIALYNQFQQRAELKQSLHVSREINFEVCINTLNKKRLELATKT